MVEHSAASNLDLKPSNLSEYVGLLEQDEERYDLIEGVLVATDDMPDVEHERIVSFIRAKGNLELHNTVAIHTRAMVYIPSRTSSAATPNVISNRTGSSGSPSRSRPASPQSASSGSSTASDRSSRDTVREPDVVVGLFREKEREASLNPTSRLIHFSKTEIAKSGPPLAVFEVTSTKTRTTDLTCKWREYWRAGIQQYVIVDRKNDCVIVGSRQGTDEEHGVRRSSGDPHDTSDRNSSGIYHRKIYRKDDLVKCVLFSNVKAKTLLNPPFGQELITKQLDQLEEENKRQKEKIQEQEKIIESQLDKSGAGSRSSSSLSPPKKLPRTERRGR